MANILRKQGQTIGSSGGSGGGGLTEEEHDALMSIASMPARGDFNIGYSTNVYVDADYTSIGYIPVVGYDKIRIYRTVSTYGGGSVYFVDSNFNSIGDAPSFTNNTWTWITIPSGAYALFLGTTPNGGQNRVAYALVTKDSPYNPDNQ